MNEFNGYTWNDGVTVYKAPNGAQVCDNCRYCRAAPVNVLTNETGDTHTLIFQDFPKRQCRYTLPPWRDVLPSDWCRMWEPVEAGGAKQP